MAAPDSADAEIPAASRARVQLADYVNTEHQPLGFTFRGIVEGDIKSGDKVLVPDKSRVLMRLVSDPDSAGNLTVELWAFKFGDDWCEVRNAESAVGLFTILKSVEDRRVANPESRPISVRGKELYIPFHSILHFETRRRLRLLNVGRYRP